MKKIAYILSAAALLALGACSDNAEETIIPENPQPEESVEYRTFVEIGADASAEQPDPGIAPDTRASYDANLAAYWEEGDRIKIISGYAATQSWKAGHQNDTKYAESLVLSKGAGTPAARFSGTITTYDAKAGYFHFAYPDSQSTISTTTDNPLIGSVTNSTTCNITIPAEQDGVWMPFMFASTDTQTTVDELSSIHFQTLNGAIALRVYEADGTTPKQIRAVTITADTDIVGTYTATTPNNGALSADLFAFEGGGRTITARNLESVGQLNGLYEYRFEVAAVTVGGLTIEVEAADGSTVTRTAYPAGKTFEARKRSGLKIVWDAASVTDGNATSWFDDYATDNLTALAPSTLYIGEAQLYGYGAASVAATGFVIEYPDGTTESIDTGAGVTRFGNIERAGLASGEYKVSSFAELTDGTRLQSGVKSVHVTAIPEISAAEIRSSYSSNGTAAPTNDIAGDEIRASFSLNDAYAAGLIGTARLNYGSNTANLKVNEQTFVKQLAWQNYDCSINVTMSNGYALSPVSYNTIVSGIPYSINFNSGSPEGWSTQNTDGSSDYLRLIYGTAWIISPAFNVPQECGVTASIAANAYSSTSSGSLNVYMSVANTGTQSGSSSTLKGNIGSSYTTITRELTLGPADANSHICVYSTGSKPSMAIGKTYGVRVKSFTVQYR